MHKDSSPKHPAKTITESITAYKTKLLQDINLKVYITLDEQTYITKIIDWIEDVLILEAPLKQLDWVVLHPNAILETKLATSSAFFATRIKVLQSVMSNGQLTYRCQITQPLKRHQQRNAFRLETVLDATYYLLNENEDTVDTLANSNSQAFNATILNISIGGTHITCEAQLTQSTRIALMFTFLETPLSLVGEVIKDGMPNTNGTYRHHIRFINLSKNEETRLNRLITNKQRLLLKITRSSHSDK